MVYEKGKAWGRSRLEVVRDGEIVQDTGFVDNLFVAEGMSSCAAKMSGQATPNPFDWIAVGSSATPAANVGDTDLSVELTANGLARAQDGTPTVETVTETNDTMSINVSFSVTGTESVNEIGLCNATGTSGGDMMGRTVLGATVSLLSGDTLNATYKITFS